MSVLPVSMYVLDHHLYLVSTEDDVTVPGTGVINGGELSCGCRELKSNPWEKQPVLLTTEIIPNTQKYF